MIVRPTVFVLGAGASVDVGYLDGKRLAERILDFLAYPASPLYGRLKLLGYNDPDIERFRRAFLKSTGTVDKFVEHNPKESAIAKFSVAHVLMAAEDDEGVTRDGNAKWYRTFREALGDSADDLVNTQVKIVTFNYDRSLEHFLHEAFLNLGGSSDLDRFRGRFGNLAFHHIHGKLSPLPWSNADGSRAYGHGKDDPHLISKCSEGIAMAHERNAQRWDLSDWTATASQIVFLGFGFDPQNIRKLNLPPVNSKSRRLVLASGLGISPNRRKALTTEFGIQFHDTIPEIFTNHDLTLPPPATGLDAFYTEDRVIKFNP